MLTFCCLSQLCKKIISLLFGIILLIYVLFKKNPLLLNESLLIYLLRESQPSFEISHIYSYFKFNSTQLNYSINNIFPLIII